MCTLPVPVYISACAVMCVHDLLVLAWSSEGYERQAASGGVVERHSDAPEIHCHPVGLLLRFPEHGSLIQVRVLWGHTGACHEIHMQSGLTGMHATKIPGKNRLTHFHIHCIGDLHPLPSGHFVTH